MVISLDGSVAVQDCCPGFVKLLFAKGPEPGIVCEPNGCVVHPDETVELLTAGVELFSAASALDAACF